MAKRGSSLLYSLNNDQIRSVVGACTTLEERFLLKAPLFLGLRVGELVHMRSDWVIPPKEVRVPAQQWCDCLGCLKQKKNPGRWSPKTKSGARIIPLTAPVRTEVLEYLDSHRNGLQMSRFVATRKIKRVLKRAHLEESFAHALRATCATKLASAGLNAAQLCYLMGWANLKTAEKYVRIAEARKDATDAMERAFE